MLFSLFFKKIAYYLILPFVFLAFSFNLLSLFYKANKIKKNKDDKTNYNDKNYLLVYKILKKIFYLKKIKVIANDFDKLTKKQYLFIANHKSIFDPACIYITLYECGYHFPLSFVAKVELAKYKIINAIMLVTKSIYINRQNGYSILECFNKQEELMKLNYSIIVFPEATRVPGGLFYKNFNPTVLKIAYKNLVSITPLSIYGADMVFSKNTGIYHKIYIKAINSISTVNYINTSADKVMEILKKQIIDNYFNFKLQANQVINNKNNNMHNKK